MSQLIRDGDRLVLALGAENEIAKPKRFDFQLFSPLLLGLMSPFVAAAYFDPEALHDLKYPIWLFLIFMLFVCTALFVYTVHFPGRVSRVEVDRGGRAVEIVWTSLLSTTTQVVPFDEISALNLRRDKDEEGQPSAIAELVLHSQRTITLPAGTSDAQLDPMRAAIGLG